MPSISELTESAKRAITAGLFDYAIAVSEHVLSHFPKCLDAYSIAGRAYLEKGIVEKAEYLFKLVLSADPEDLAAHIGLGVALRDTGNKEGALEQFARALDIKPNSLLLRQEIKRIRIAEHSDKTEKIKLSRSGLARLYMKDGLYEKAMTELRAVLKIDPTRLDAMVALGETLWLAGDKIDAHATCSSILTLSPDCLKPKLILADIQYSEGYINEAQSMLTSARNLDPANIMARSLLAERAIMAILPPDTGFDIPALGTRTGYLESPATI